MGGGFERQPGKTSLAHEASSKPSPASTTPGKRTLTEQLPPRHDPHPVERLVHGPDAGAAVQRRVDPGGAASATLAQDALSQATYLKQTLASWQLDKAVDPTLTFLGRRMGELADASKLTLR